MLNFSNPYKRYAFCLIVSGVLHGGIVALDWQKQTDRKLSAMNVHEIVLKKAIIVDDAEQENKSQERLLASKHLIKKLSATKRYPQAKTDEKVSLEKKSLAKAQGEVDSDLLLDDFTENKLQKPINSSNNNKLSQAIIEPQATRNSLDDKVVSAASRQTKTTFDGYNSSVEAQPRYQDNPLPEYPLLARRRNLEGVVWLRVHVAPNGTVRKVSLEKTSGHELLDRSAQNAVRNWTFMPAMRAGVPVECQVKVPVHFQLHKS